MAEEKPQSSHQVLSRLAQGTQVSKPEEEVVFEQSEREVRLPPKRVFNDPFYDVAEKALRKTQTSGGQYLRMMKAEEISEIKNAVIYARIRESNPEKKNEFEAFLQAIKSEQYL